MGRAAHWWNKGVKNSKNAAYCLHRPPSQAVIILIFGGGAVSRSWQPCCIESGGWGFYKVLQDAFFCSCFLSWDMEHKQLRWLKQGQNLSWTHCTSVMLNRVHNILQEMNFNEASLHPRIILKEMLLRFIRNPAWSIPWAVTWPLWVQK